MKDYKHNRRHTDPRLRPWHVIAAILIVLALCYDWSGTGDQQTRADVTRWGR